jgi:hypothetical protein
MKTITEVVRMKEEVEHDLLARPGVTGVDVGPKYVGGQRTSEIAIRVLVAKKKKSGLSEAEKVPATIDGVKTDVIERTYVLHQMNRKKIQDVELMADTTMYNPVKGGISLGPCRAVGGYVYVGTLGAIVRDNVTNNPLLLSNFHVMCIDNGWHVGDTMAQPGRVDGGSCPTNVVGTLQRAVLSSHVDGAVCSLSGRGYACEIVDIGAVAGTSAATLNMAVRKRGRTTGLTYGQVDSISLTINVDYGPGIGVRTLSNQIGLAPNTSHNAKFGDHGDSGSAVVNDARQIVGLYFAGSEDGSGVANPIASVLAELNVSVCTGAVKSRLKDILDNKRHVKEYKREKYEVKDFKREKFEMKEHKPEKFEFEVGKRFTDLPPKFSEGGDPLHPPTNPVQPGGPLEHRLAQLEATVGQLAAFITPEMRPDLGAGALAGEPDCGGCGEGGGGKLDQDAADALQAKVNFDTKPADR